MRDKEQEKKNIENLIPKLLQYPCRLEESPIFGTMLVFENADTDDILENVIALINAQNKLNIFISKKPKGPGAIGFYVPPTPDRSPDTIDNALTNIFARINQLYGTQIDSPFAELIKIKNKCTDPLEKAKATHNIIHYLALTACGLSTKSYLCSKQDQATIYDTVKNTIDDIDHHSHLITNINTPENFQQISTSIAASLRCLYYRHYVASQHTTMKLKPEFECMAESDIKIDVFKFSNSRSIY